VSGPFPTLLLIWLAAAIASGTALILQYGFGHAPCHLCLYERLPYYALLALLPVAAALRRPRLGLLLAGLLLLGNAGLSAYHVAVEQGLVTLPESCVAGAAATTIEELRAQLMGARPTCDQVSLRFLGLSLAAWNLVASLVLGLVSLLAAGRGLSGLRR
jgi:disulfide bond formation protein DsbB